MEYIAEFALFFAKTITLVGGVLAVVMTMAMVSQKVKKMQKGYLEITGLNAHFRYLQTSLQQALLDKPALKKALKEAKQSAQQEKKQGKTTTQKPKVFVIDFHGDLKASAVKSLREEVTAVLTMARQEKDEVVVKLESAGGLVHAYGLAASQLCRIRNKGIPLTVAVDKVAASGGYMMACTAHRIIAAPFAVIGSVGVMAQLPNFHRLLKKHDVDLELHTAGEYKRTLTVFGKNTDKGREKFKQDIEDTHRLFKDFIQQYRSQVDIAKAATGEIWYGQRALAHQLVDALMTSDEYISQKIEQADVVQVAYVVKKGLTDKLSTAVQAAGQTVMETAFTAGWERTHNRRFFS